MNVTRFVVAIRFCIYTTYKSVYQIEITLYNVLLYSIFIENII